MADLKIFAKTIEPSAKAQIDLLLQQEPFKDCKVRIMPDVHAGAGCVIGFTADLGYRVIPNIVGVDIGCGMLVVRLGKIDIDYPRLDATIRELVPAGRAVHEAAQFRASKLEVLNCLPKLRNIDHIQRSLGTLGGGNHFIEIDASKQGDKYLIIHTGSRNLGKQVAEIYQDMAIRGLHTDDRVQRAELIDRLKAAGREKEISDALKQFKAESTCSIPDDLCYLEGEQRDDYLGDMKFCQFFAACNRALIARRICKYMGWECLTQSFQCVHNYIGEDNIVRKGAISARAGRPVIIPINMHDGCIIGAGRGNPDWNYSAPHGAGRTMSRAQARANIPLEEYQKVMQGVYTTSVCPGTLDEAPQAYKSLDDILSCIAPTVIVQDVITPVYNFKAAE